MSDPSRIERLLGSAQPELGCDECFEYLDRYVEQELGLEGVFAACRACVSPTACAGDQRCLGMRAHLVGCPACAEEYESLKALARENSSE